MLKKKDRIIGNIRKLQGRYLKKKHKFAMELPKTVGQTPALYAKNGDTLWSDAISKKLIYVRVAFEVLPWEVGIQRQPFFVKLYGIQYENNGVKT